MRSANTVGCRSPKKYRWDLIRWAQVRSSGSRRSLDRPCSGAGQNSLPTDGTCGQKRDREPKSLDREQIDSRPIARSIHDLREPGQKSPRKSLFSSYVVVLVNPCGFYPQSWYKRLWGFCCRIPAQQADGNKKSTGVCNRPKLVCWPRPKTPSCLTCNFRVVTVPENYSVPSHIGYKTNISTSPENLGTRREFCIKSLANCILKKQFLI